MIELTPELFKGRPPIVSESWVSNGQWAVHKDRLPERQRVLCSTANVAAAWLDRSPDAARDFTPEQMAAAVKVPEKLVALHRTHWVVRLRISGIMGEVYASEDKSVVAAIDQVFVDGFHLGEMVYGTGPSERIFDDATAPTVVCMPVRWDEDLKPTEALLAGMVQP